MNKLKKCPFCGEKRASVTSYNVVGKRYYVVCHSCYCHGPNCKTEAGAIETWEGSLIEEEIQRKNRLLEVALEEFLKLGWEIPIGLTTMIENELKMDGHET